MEPAHSTTLVSGPYAPETTMNRPTYYIGIDVAADTFTAALFTAPGQPTVVAPQCANTVEGLEAFHHWLGHHRAMPENAVLCLEATGVYAETLCYYLCSKGLPRCC
jgi:transposase